MPPAAAFARREPVSTPQDMPLMPHSHFALPCSDKCNRHCTSRNMTPVYEYRQNQVREPTPNSPLLRHKRKR